MTGKRPLEGLVAIDFTTMVAGPACTRALADCGAEVIKVEAADGGDLMRRVPPHREGMGLVFALYNAGKKSVVVDLKSPEGRSRARSLVETCDIVVENFRPGVMKRLGLDYQTVSHANPKVIYCSISGFGQTGPFSNRAAYAPVAHAFSGFDMMLARLPDASALPFDNRIMVADIIAGANAFGAIQAALVHRLRNGAGSHVDVTMAEGMMALVGIQLQHAQADAPHQNEGFPAYQTRDGFVTIPLVSENTYRGACGVVGRSDLMSRVDFAAVSDRDRLRKEVRVAIAAWTETRSSEECDLEMAAAGVPCSIYFVPEDLFAHPHVAARRSFSPVDIPGGTVKVLNLPFKISTACCDARRTVPKLGEHTDEVFSGLLARAPEQRLGCSSQPPEPE
jgi:CoA:oxalate CoA-transferase